MQEPEMSDDFKQLIRNKKCYTRENGITELWVLDSYGFDQRSLTHVAQFHKYTNSACTMNVSDDQTINDIILPDTQQLQWNASIY